MKPSILIIDDSPSVLASLLSILKSQYLVRVANNAVKGLELAITYRPDLILLDTSMPGKSGLDTCYELKIHSVTKRIPVIFMAEVKSVRDEEFGFSLGAVDYIDKSINPVLLQARIRAHLGTKIWLDHLQAQNSVLNLRVHDSGPNVEGPWEKSIDTLIFMLNGSGCPENYRKRQERYIKLLTDELALLPKYTDVLDEHTIATFVKFAPLHDIGKLAVSDAILDKCDTLSRHEFGEVKMHAQKGCELLEKICGSSYCEAGSAFSFAVEGAHFHHEKWDGSGYPDGLKGESIPLAGRIMAIVDVYDALRSERPFRPAVSHAEAMKQIVWGKGTQFDPEIVDAFLVQSKEYDVLSKYLY